MGAEQPEQRDATDYAAQRGRLRRLAGWASALSAPFVLAELITWFLHRNQTLLIAVVIHAAVGLALLGVRRIAATRQLEVATHLFGYVLLGGTLAGAILVNAGSHFQVLIPTLAVAVVYPYLSGRSLVGFFVVALVAQFGFGLLAIMRPTQDLIPGRAEGLLELSVMLGAFCLSLFVLRQFSTRLRGMVHQAEEATERASRIAAENLRLYKEAEAAVRARDDFLSVASHELKTPLTPIHLQLQRLLRLAQQPAAPGLTPEELAPKLEGLLRTTVRLERLVDRLLDISKVTGARITATPEPVDLVSIARRVIAELEPMLKSHGCAVELVTPDQVLGLWDQLSLEHILVNLITNAAKFGASQPIEVGVRMEAGNAVIVVRDHGIGIAPHDQARIFGRYERAVSTRHYGGLGLGLWIVQRTVETMHGTVRLESELGKGSAFFVELPVQRFELGAPAPKVASLQA